MSWIAARSSTQNAMFNPGGLDAGRFDAQVPREAMQCGTLLLDIFMPDTLEHPFDFIDYEKWQGHRRSLNLLLDPRGKLWLAIEQGAQLQIASLDLVGFPAGAPVRIQYSWDASLQVSHLSAQNITTGDIKYKQFSQASALAMDDLARIFFRSEDHFLAPQITAFCIANHIEKIGYSSGLGSNSYVKTERGPVPIGQLKAGDLVVTHDGGLSAIQGTVQSYMPAYGHIRPVELRRPLLNLSHTLAVSADTCVILEGSDAEYYFGCHAVSVSTRHIIPFLPLPYANSAPLVTLHQIILQDAKPFCASGGTFIPISVTHDVFNSDLHAQTRLGSMPASTLIADTPLEPAASHSVQEVPRNLFAHEATVLLSERYL